jgi:hypothetical protein
MLIARNQHVSKLEEKKQIDLEINLGFWMNQWVF